MSKMSSKERMLTALKGEKPDYTPCSIYFNNALRIKGYDLSDTEERIKCYMDLGTEPVVDIALPAQKTYGGVKIRTWVEEISGCKYPVLFKEYTTPEGVLRQGVLHTPDWPFGMDIPFPGNDHCASNNYESLIKSPDDVKAFKYLWVEADEESVEEWRSQISRSLSLAAKYNVITRATVGQGLAGLMFCMGAENFVLFAVDYPDAFRELAAFEHHMTIKRMKIAKNYGVDLFKRFGGYEQTNFFSPSIYKEIVVPFAKKEVLAAKGLNTPMYYRVVTGMKPLLADIAEIGFDCVEGFEPELSNCTNYDIKNALGNISVIWTGVSSPVHLGAADDGPVRKAVKDAMRAFEGENFILGVTNSIRPHWPWENTLAMVDEWKKYISGRAE